MEKKDSNIYIKVGRRYEPVGYYFSSQNTWLTEGVWVVLKRPYSKEIVNGNHLKAEYGIDKISDLKDFTFAELGDVHKTAEEVMSRFPHDWFKTSHSLSETVCMALGRLKEIQEQDKSDKPSEKE